MCVTCGCGQAGKIRIEGEQGAHPQGEHAHVLPDGTRIVHSHGDAPGIFTPVDSHEHEHAHVHAHVHDHTHEHVHDHPHPHAHAHDEAALRRDTPVELVELETALLDKNQRIAEHNRGWLAGRGVVALNLMSSPGAGKTSLLVRTLADLAGELPMCVVEGDQETTADADRIRATGARALQINTGAGCHLEADMLQRALHTLSPPAGSIVFVENVGNLVCPALFDLGEQARIVMLSVTEGEDKPLKYPHMFRSAQWMVLTKTDLLPHVGFDAERAEANARSINPSIRCLRVSATSGEGLRAWYDLLRTMRQAAAGQDA